MLVYRISLTQYASTLVASGNAARWNGKGKFMIYTAATRALACLENVVHRSGEGLMNHFRIMEIYIPDGLDIQYINKGTLKDHWSEFLEYDYCQNLGNEWLSEMKTAVLCVPSAIIPDEKNYLLNPQHSDFQQIKLLNTEPFVFDGRIKTM